MNAVLQSGDMITHIQVKTKVSGQDVRINIQTEEKRASVFFKFSEANQAAGTPMSSADVSLNLETGKVNTNLNNVDDLAAANVVVTALIAKIKGVLTELNLTNETEA